MLDLEWRALSRGPGARGAFAQLRARHAELRPFGHLGELPGRLGELGEARYGVLGTMLELAADEPLLRRGLLQAAVPGLPGVARRIGWGAPSFSRSECMAELVAIAWELTGRWAGQRRAYAIPDLLSATRLRAMRRVLAMRPTTSTLDLEGLAGGSDDDDVAWRLDFMDLARDLPRQRAAALYAQVVLGMGTAETAGSLGVSARTVQRWNRAVATGLLAPPAVA